MSISFYGNELIDVAIGIERRGIAFYEIMAGSVRNAAARDIFWHLAGMERGHIEILQGMLSETENKESPEAYTGEYAAYLQALADNPFLPRTGLSVTGSQRRRAISPPSILASPLRKNQYSFTWR